MLTLRELDVIRSEASQLRSLVPFLRDQGYDLNGIARFLSLSEPAESLLTHTARHSFVLGGELSEQRSILGTLVQLFLFACRVDLRAYSSLPASVRDLCERYKLVSVEGERVRGEVSISEFNSAYFLSDRLFENRGNYDIAMSDAEGLVMPVHESSLRLLHSIHPSRRGTFLDIGTGCGVQAISTRAGCSRSKAIDLSIRAVTVATINATLNEVEVECEQGDCFSFADGCSYDCVVFNAPWVLEYKSSAPLSSTSPATNVLRFIDDRVEDLLAEGGECLLWSVFPILHGDDSVKRIFERALPRLERFQIAVQTVRQGGFHVPAAAIERRKIPRGCYLLQDPSDAQTLVAFLDRNSIREVLPVLIRVRHTGEQGPGLRVEEDPSNPAALL